MQCFPSNGLLKNSNFRLSLVSLMNIFSLREVTNTIGHANCLILAHFKEMFFMKLRQVAFLSINSLFVPNNNNKYFEMLCYKC